MLDNNGTCDLNWNAVWEGKTAISDSLWTAEMKIPLSQLRYSADSVQVWGMHAWRWMDRFQEEDQWSLIPRKNSGTVYSFGQLTGIEGLRKSRRVELRPYLLAKTNVQPVEEDNPFSKNYKNAANIGLDGKIGIGSNFTLDMTVNPDFGQVEADPSVMNLSNFETYYDEKRSFFLEGKNILNYNFRGDLLFYSRRIGHSPSYKPDDKDGMHYSRPENTSIIDAIKFTGKTSNGLSLGIMQSLTNKEDIKISDNGIRSVKTAEPTTNYMVTRVQQDFNKGNTILGGILTSTNRFINDSHLNFLPKNAYTGGFDFKQYFNNRNWYIEANGICSHIQGDTMAINNLQKATAHYFQRPDAGYLHVDSSKTSLTGTGGSFIWGRKGTHKLQFAHSCGFRSPSLELNDLGYFTSADMIVNNISGTWNETEPNGVFRNYSINFSLEDFWNFGGVNYYNQLYVSHYASLKSKWETNGHIAYGFDNYDLRVLRGGPMLRNNPYWTSHLGVNTDYSKTVAGYTSVYNTTSCDGITSFWGAYAGMRLILFRWITVNTEINNETNTNDIQYVTTETVNNKPTYVLALLKQNTLSFTFRLNLNVNPEFSVQYYGSPYLTAGKYTNFKEVTNNTAQKHNDRFYAYKANEINALSNNEKYAINGLNGSYTIDNPDFTMGEFKSNLVARWEYKRGSVIYLVWAHQKSEYTSHSYTRDFEDNAGAMWGTMPDNLFLVKFNYYLSL
jgi:hypothetical protein